MEKNGFLEFLFHPLRSIWRLTFGEAEDAMAQEGPFRLTMAVVFFPLFVVAQFVLFLFLNWTVSRNGRRFLYGIPALTMVVLAATALFIFASFQSKVANRYRGDFQKAFQAEQFEVAGRWCEKILELDPEDQEYRYLYLVLREQTDGKLAAINAMEELAPLEPSEEGNLQAHVWCAGYYLSDETEEPSSQDERWELARQHLKKAESLLKNRTNQVLILDRDPKTLAMFRTTFLGLGQIARQRNDSEKAIEYLNQVAKYDIGVYPTILQIMKEQTDKKDPLIRANADRFTEAIYKQVTLEPNNFYFWQTLIRCYVESGNYREAIRKLDSSRRMVTNLRVNQRISLLQSEICVHAAEFEDVDGTEKEKFIRKVSWLGAALRVNPYSSIAIAKMMELLRQPKGPLTADQINWLLNHAIDRPSDFIANLMLGLDSGLKSMGAAINDKQKQSAMLQWKLAISQNGNARIAIAAAANILSLTDDTPEENQADNAEVVDPSTQGSSLTEDQPESAVQDSNPKNSSMEFSPTMLTERQRENTLKAVKLMDLAIEMEPDQVFFLETRGILQFRLGLYQFARDDLRTAYELDTNRLATLKYLVLCSQKLKLDNDIDRYQSEYDKLKIKKGIKGSRNSG